MGFTCEVARVERLALSFCFDGVCPCLLVPPRSRRPPFPPKRTMPGGAHEFMKAWDPEEDQIILEMVQAEGPKWKQIVKRLPGRTVRVASRRSRGLCMGLASP